MCKITLKKQLKNRNKGQKDLLYKIVSKLGSAQLRENWINKFKKCLKGWTVSNLVRSVS